MFDMITLICQHKFQMISTMKTPIAMSGKNQINYGEGSTLKGFIYICWKKFLWCMSKLENTSDWQQITTCYI